MNFVDCSTLTGKCAYVLEHFPDLASVDVPFVRKVWETFYGHFGVDVEHPMLGTHRYLSYSDAIALPSAERILAARRRLLNPKSPTRPRQPEPVPWYVGRD